MFKYFLCEYSFKLEIWEKKYFLKKFKYHSKKFSLNEAFRDFILYKGSETLEEKNSKIVQKF